MGWSYGWSKRAELIAHLSKTFEREASKETFEYKGLTVPAGLSPSDFVVKNFVLKKCFKGSPFKGTLWSVREVNIVNKMNGDVIYKHAYIACDLLQCSNYGGTHEWGYKDMDESCGPCYYNCPLSYLDMAPQADSEHAGPWREKVRAFHAGRKLPAGLQYGDTISLKDGCTPAGNYKVFSMRPFMALSLTNGMVYKLSKRHVKEIVGKVGTDKLVNQI